MAGKKGVRWKNKPSMAERLLRSSIEEPTSGCRIWLAAWDHSGYGLLTVEDDVAPRGRKSVKAHRLAYQTWVGPIPPGYQVCHRCDTPSCIAPRHLFVGTADDNNRDMIAKRRARAPYGETHGRAKFSDDIIRAVSAATQTGENQYEIAARFNMTQSMVSLIKRRLTRRRLLNG
jgi:hypothetical protein